MREVFSRFFLFFLLCFWIVDLTYRICLVSSVQILKFHLNLELAELVFAYRFPHLDKFPTILFEDDCTATVILKNSLKHDERLETWAG